MKQEDLDELIHSYPRNVYKKLESSSAGLSDEEAKKRLAQYGKNEINKQAKTPMFKVFISNFISPMAILLWASGLLSLISSFIGDHSNGKILSDPSMLYLAIAIWLVNIINGVFSFIQQNKASKANDSLMKMLPHFSRVIRNGEEKKIDASELVVGDVVILQEGDRVSADCRILLADDLSCNQSSLDGETTPARKTNEIIKGDVDSIIQAKNLIFAGTSIATGNCRAIVYATGMDTEFGKVASLTMNIKPTKTPLQKDIDKATKQITTIALTVGLIVFLLGIIVNGIKNGFNNPNLYITQFIFALGMVVAFIPEGLYPTVTLSLARACQRMAKEGALIKNLTSVEALGSTTVICTDKTGTLTKNEMTVKSLFFDGEEYEVTGDGYDPKGDILNNSNEKQLITNNKTLKKLLTIGALCQDSRIIKPTKDNPHYQVLGDPTEACLLVSAEKGLLHGASQANITPRIRELPFDSTRKMMSSIHQLEVPINNASRISYTKGAPKEVLEKCNYICINGEVKKLTDKDRQVIMAKNDYYAANGLRVLAMAYRLLPKDEEGLPIALSSYTPEIIEKNMVFVGLQALQDPPRDGIKESIEKCHQAHIKVIMITGDYGLTAKAIGKKIGIVQGEPLIITGNELAKMNDDELKANLKKEVIFARMAPDQKYRIVNALQEMGEIVAVTGDGINDAPALKKADIGVAMGITGTDVAKDSADMILTDDNFSTIVKAIEEGRAVYQNIKKFITYIFNSNVPEAIPFILPLLTFNLVPQPLTIMEVLAIDLGTDMLPALGLGQELPTKSIMQDKPREKSTHLIDTRLLIKAYSYGALTTILCLIAYFAFNGIMSMKLGIPYHLFNKNDPLDPNGSAIWMASTGVVLVSIIFSQIGIGLCLRDSRESIFKIKPFSNKLMNIGIISEIVLAFLIIYLPWINNNVFETSYIMSYEIWLIILTFPFITLLLGELVKWIANKRRVNKNRRKNI